ncbi:MAG TPA: hypothetical protein VN653_07855 [Anaerolineales bacterium]|nr:hypothetical protein [Anaerolineales bacterium]
MKIIDKVVVPLVLIIILTACSELAMNSGAIATESAETVLVYVQTALAATQSALPANTSTPLALPTFALPTSSITPAASISRGFVPPPQARLDFAMTTAPKVYNRLPYISELGPSGGEYSGCVNTNDFSNAVYYGIEHPLDIVTSAFDEYFQLEEWAFTEKTTKLVGDQIKVPEVSYEVYRILPSETPAMERLRIILRDESSFRGKDYIDVRSALTHIETKSNLKYLGDFSCGLNKHWLWIHLNK